MLFCGIYLIIGTIIAGRIAYEFRNDNMLKLMADINMSDTMKFICIIGIVILAWPIEILGGIWLTFQNK